jgi:hypothetical protein
MFYIIGKIRRNYSIDKSPYQEALTLGNQACGTASIHRDQAGRPDLTSRVSRICYA